MKRDMVLARQIFLSPERSEDAVGLVRVAVSYEGCTHYEIAYRVLALALKMVLKKWGEEALSGVQFPTL